MPGSTWQIRAALQREWTYDRGRRFPVMADMASASPAMAVAELAADRPLVVGTMGHAMVLTAVEYVSGGWSDAEVTSAVVRDPWPGRGRRVLSAQEWYGADLLVRIAVTPVTATPERWIPDEADDGGEVEIPWAEVLRLLSAW